MTIRGLYFCGAGPPEVILVLLRAQDIHRTCDVLLHVFDLGVNRDRGQVEASGLSLQLLFPFVLSLHERQRVEAEHAAPLHLSPASCRILPGVSPESVRVLIVDL